MIVPRVAAALLGLAVLAGDPPPDEQEAARLLFLLQHVAFDYGRAVRDGRVVNALEYDEALALASSAPARYLALRGPSAGSKLAAGLANVQASIRRREAPDRVSALIGGVVNDLSDMPGGSTLPKAPPDLARGRELFLRDCAACHGKDGAGDGWAARDMNPSPGSLRDTARMNLLSPRYVRGSIQFGIDGTPMPSFEGAYATGESWDIAFHVMTLRDGFDATSVPGPSPISLEDLSRRSNNELLLRLRELRPEASLAEIDRARSSVHRTSPLDVAAAPTVATAEGPGDDADLEIARRLERAFTRVADRVFPSVVGVSLFRRQVGPAQKDPGADQAAGWQRTDLDEVYPGYRRVRSRSGVLVSDDGYVLTCGHLLDPSDLAPADTILDVEVGGGQRFRAWIVGVEPTVDLAVLKVEAPIGLPPATLGNSDGMRTGRWAIAMGDPPGPEKDFVFGTIAAHPQQECYQEDRTQTLLQWSARLPAESFGGPLVDLDGHVIGITVPADRDVLRGGRYDGPAFALPINLVRTLFEALRVKQSTRSPWLGVAVRVLTWDERRAMHAPQFGGISIENVFDPSPASRVGIRPGDLLMEIDGNRINAVHDFQLWLYLLGIDKTVTLKVFRDGGMLERRATIEQRPAAVRPR